MQKLDLNELVSYPEYWKENLKPEEAEKYIHLSRKLLHMIVDNDGILSGITLSFPEDCLGDDLSNYYVFSNFLEMLGARRTTKRIQGKKIMVTKVTFD